MRGKGTGRVRSPSRPSLDPSSPWLEFVKQSVHLWSFGLRLGCGGVILVQIDL